jgi:hypothetical protein
MSCGMLIAELSFTNNFNSIGNVGQTEVCSKACFVVGRVLYSNDVVDESAV